MAIKSREEFIGLAVFAVTLVLFVYGAILHVRGITGVWPTVLLVGGGLLGFAFAGYLIVIYEIRNIVESK